MDVAAELDEAIRRYNLVSIREVELESGLKWLGEEGPIYRLGTVVARGLFVGKDGEHWGDVGLIVESNWPPGTIRDWAWEQFTFEELPTYEAMLWSHARGRFSALFVALNDIAFKLELGDPQRSTDGWARGWGSLPHVSDASERGLVSLGADTIVGGIW